MHQKDMERFAFLFLCGKRDREILLGKEKMTFSDLDRLTYVTDFLGLNLYNLEIWNKYSGQFGEQFRQLELLYDETCSIVSWESTEADEHLHERWIREFCIQVPDKEISETAGINYKTTISGTRDGRSHRDRHRVGACLFFTEN